MPRKKTPKPAIAWPRPPMRWAPGRQPHDHADADHRQRHGVAASKPVPASTTSQAVVVVPILVPKTTQTAGASPSRPALTKPIVATVTALEERTSAVMKMPAASPRRGELVAEARMRCRSRRRRASALPSSSRRRSGTGRCRRGWELEGHAGEVHRRAVRGRAPRAEATTARRSPIVFAGSRPAMKTPRPAICGTGRRCNPPEGGDGLHARHDHRVDDVDDAVRGLDVGLHDVGAVDHRAVGEVKVTCEPSTVAAIMPSSRSPDITAPGTTW
jgi:hypothetical protein